MLETFSRKVQLVHAGPPLPRRLVGDGEVRSGNVSHGLTG